MKTNTLFILSLLTVNILFSQSFTEVTDTFFDGVWLSSIAFADVDGDTDQDVLITGQNATFQSITKLYTNNGNGIFTEVTGTPFDNVSHSSITFADVDGDTDQDVLITGMKSSNLQEVTKLYTNDGNGVFTEVTGTPFDDVSLSSIAFADVDGDTDQDVLITGQNTDSQPITKLYTNNGNGVFTEVTGTPFDSVDASSIAFTDVDGDTDQDVLITGKDSSFQPIAKLYTNNGNGVFTEVTGTPFSNVSYSSIAFADVDSDTDQDVIITGGGSSSRITKLYTNNGNGVFTEVTGTPFDSVDASSIAFTDVDGDTDQDVLITGKNAAFQPIAKLYTNNGNGVFTEVTSMPFEGVWLSSIAFADVDGDTDQDVLITGQNEDIQQIAKLYINNLDPPLSTNELTLNNNLIVSNQENNILVSTNNGNKLTNIKVFDILSKQLININATNEQVLVPIIINRGTLLFIKATLENGIVLNKKFIKL